MAMCNPQGSRNAPLNTETGGLLLANMLADWLKQGTVFALTVEEVAEAVHESQDHRTAPPQAGVRIPAPVDPRPSTSPSREHGAAVCSARESTRVGLERSGNPHSRPRPGNIWVSDGGERRFQDFSGGRLDGTSGRGVCSGSLTAGPL